MPSGRTRGRLLRRLGVALALVVAALVVLALVSRRRMILLGERYPPPGSLVRVDDLLLHYEARGTGPAVLLLHGCPGFTRDFKIVPPGKESVFADLARDHTVVALDRPGHGWSERYQDRYTTLDVQADLVPLFLGELGIETAVLVGHSYGGSLALATAVRHPEAVDGIVLLGAATHAWSFQPDPLDRLLVTPGIGPILRWSLGPILVPPMAHDALQAAFAPDEPPPGYGDVIVAFASRPPQLHQMAVELLHLPGGLEELTPRYPELRLPVTVITGARDSGDMVQGNKRLAEEIPDARLIVVDDLGHEVPHLRPQLVAAEVRRITQPAAGTEETEQAQSADTP